MNRKFAATIVSLVIAVMAGMVPSHAASDVVYVSGPGEQFKGYLLPALVIQAGTPVDYLNADITAHSVIADRFGVDKGWCAASAIPPGKCPLFGSPASVSSTQRAPIYEIQSLPAGTYTFHCGQHPSAQKGTLVVV